MIPRHLNILKSNSFFLFGARGTGKTTLLNAIFSDQEAYTINLLLPEDFDPLLKRPQSLIERIDALPPSIKWVVIDEVQKLPGLLDLVHHLIEKKRVRFGLTGSSARKLKRGSANLLAGRAFLYHLFPFTHQELGDPFDLSHALEFGALPKVFEFTDRESKGKFLSAYTQTYLKEEIMVEQLVRSLAPFRRFLEIAAQMNGELINFKSISRDVGVDDKTVRSYFQILEDTLLGFFLEPFHRSLRKTQTSSPKFYFFDGGVQRNIAGLSLIPLSPSNFEYGKAFEHFVLIELWKLNAYQESKHRFYFYRTQQGVEIDLVMEGPTGQLSLIEVKSTRDVRDDHLKHLHSLDDKFPKARKFCLSLDPHPKKIDGVLCFPWKEGIRELGFG